MELNTRAIARSLRSCFAVEVLIIRLRVRAGMVHDSVTMVRGRIKCVELQ
jgi:hypothetical protein